MHRLARNTRISIHNLHQYRNERFLFGKIAAYFKGESKEDAARAMKDAVKELSKGITPGGLPAGAPGAMIAPVSSVDTLMEWDNVKDLKSLSIEQISELARAHFDGNFGEETARVPNRPRSIQLWQIILEKDPDNLEASYSLASCYQSGAGTHKDAILAFSMMQPLADKKDYHLAHYAVAIMYRKGEGVSVSPENDKKAFQHFRAAAKHGVQPALFNIGNCFSGGIGVDKNDKYAAQYYSAAAEAGDPAGKFTLGTWMVQGRGGLEKDLKKAFDMQCEAGQSGHPGAMFNAGCHLMTGQGCKIDESLAAQWFERAADEGNIPEACVNLGNMYRIGRGVDKDLIRARNLYARHAMTHSGCRELLHSVEAEIKASL